MRVLRRRADERHPYFAFIDEFQEFLNTGRDMGAFFERSRSYGVGMCVATQNVRHPELRPILDSLLINTRTHVVFGGLREQSRLVAMEMAPTFGPEDLDRRDACQMVVKTLVDNQPVPPFSARVGPIPPMDQKRFELLRGQCRLEAGRPRDEVETLVQERYRRLGVRLPQGEARRPTPDSKTPQDAPSFGDDYDFRGERKDPDVDGRDGGRDA